ncbi:hypothetical protein ACFLW2_04850 [Chloroflexota bacterium]
MQTITNELESFDAMIDEFLIMREETIQTMKTETRAIDKTVSNIFIETAYYLKHNEGEQALADIKKLEYYENKMQELLSLKEEVIETKMNEDLSIDDLFQGIAKPMW